MEDHSVDVVLVFTLPILFYNIAIKFPHLVSFIFISFCFICLLIVLSPVYKLSHSVFLLLKVKLFD